jgi:hypothetical protein
MECTIRQENESRMVHIIYQPLAKLNVPDRENGGAGWHDRGERNRGPGWSLDESQMYHVKNEGGRWAECTTRGETEHIGGRYH